MLSYATHPSHVRRSDDEMLFPLSYLLVLSTAGGEDAVTTGELFVIEDSKAALPAVAEHLARQHTQTAGQLLNLRWRRAPRPSRRPRCRRWQVPADNARGKDFRHRTFEHGQVEWHSSTSLSVKKCGLRHFFRETGPEVIAIAVSGSQWEERLLPGSGLSGLAA